MHLRPLTPADRPALQELLDADPGYARRVTGADPDKHGAADLLADRPDGLAAEDKVVLGVYDDGGLAAVVDVLRGWPDASTALIGLLQVHARCQGTGVGRRAHELLLDLVGTWPGITQLRAAIVATNAAAADPFWTAMGYRPAGPPAPYRAGDTATQVTVWTRSVPRSPR